MTSSNGPLRIGIGGPVGSGKTTLTEKLCKALRDEFSIADITGLVAIDFMKPARITVPPELANVTRWHRALAARPSASA